MAQSLSRVLVHVIFSVKNRDPLIHEEIQPRLHAYISAILTDIGCVPVQTGGVSDHVHTLFGLSRTLTIADAIKEIKIGSSKWMKNEGVANFAWQGGYGAFSIGQSQAATAIKYIQNQKERHRRMTFKEELLKFLKAYEVPYDEKYLWE